MGRGQRGHLGRAGKSAARQQSLRGGGAGLYRAGLSHGARGQSGGQTVLQGVSDRTSWRAGGKPLIFDDEYAKKPAYGALMRVLQTAAK
ncbi:endo-1,4-beta-xylanase [Deinococcus frigens]|uniref:endo-1,4-beta-xylanase n=1 Tax=Deinococcus frigens TaxID=249403 RepID=UPI0039EE72AD